MSEWQLMTGSVVGFRSQKFCRVGRFRLRVGSKYYYLPPAYNMWVNLFTIIGHHMRLLASVRMLSISSRASELVSGV